MNDDASEQIAALATAYHEGGLPVLHIRHREDDPTSPMHADAAGYHPMHCAAAIADEPVFTKQSSSAFASTHLAVHLQQQGITELVVTGAVAGFCVNSTVISGSDTWFTITVVQDAVIGFDLPNAGLSAQMIFDVTMAHLLADFARLVDTETELNTLGTLV